MRSWIASLLCCCWFADSCKADIVDDAVSHLEDVARGKVEFDEGWRAYDLIVFSKGLLRDPHGDETRIALLGKVVGVTGELLATRNLAISTDQPVLHWPDYSKYGLPTIFAGQSLDSIEDPVLRSKYQQASDLHDVAMGKLAREKDILHHVDRLLSYVHGLTTAAKNPQAVEQALEKALTRFHNVPWIEAYMRPRLFPETKKDAPINDVPNGPQTKRPVVATTEGKALVTADYSPPVVKNVQRPKERGVALGPACVPKTSNTFFIGVLLVLTGLGAAFALNRYRSN